MVESRTVKTLRNTQVAILFYCLNLLLQFFSRKIFLDYLGSEVLGLNTTVQNLLGFLNLAELGIGAAIAYSLYQPLFNDNRKQINDIVSVQGWLYRNIATFVIFGAIVLVCFFPKIFGKAELPLWYAYGSFFVLLFSSLLGYYVNYRQIVLSADQKEYKITYVTQGCKLLKVLLQIVAISMLSQGYVWWLVLEVVFAIVTSVWLDIVIRCEYPWLKPKISKGRELRKEYPQITKKTKQLFFHKVAYFALTQTSPLIIYAYASLSLVAIYGNYVLITMGVQSLMNAMLNGIGAGVGNLVAEGDNKKIKDFFWELTSLRLWIAAVICFAIYMLADSFIILWVGYQYLMPTSAFVILVLITFVQLTRTCDVFLNAYGLFQDIWAPVVEAALNIGFSILLGYYFGLTGILTGVLLSLLLVVVMWKPYFLFTRAFKESPLLYFIRLIKQMVVLLAVAIGGKYLIGTLIENAAQNWIWWLLSVVITVSMYGSVSLFLMNVTDGAARRITRRLINIVCKK